MMKVCDISKTAAFLCGFTVLMCAVTDVTKGQNTTLDEARAFLDEYNERAELIYHEVVLAYWAYYTNLTDYNLRKQTEQIITTAEFDKIAFENASRFDATNFPNDVKRELMFIKDIGPAALQNVSKIEEYDQVISAMLSFYSSGEVCKPDNASECYTLSPALDGIMANSVDFEELKWAWKGFRDKVGVGNKPHYIRYVQLSNEIAQANGYPDMGAYWRANYEADDIIQDAYDLYEEILPLYKQLHAYVRRKLTKYYAEEIDVKGKLPANVLGDMWGRFWGQIYDLVVPYPDKPNIDVTDEMIKQGYTVQKMFNLTDEFFTSCGLIPANQQFWDNSQFVKPADGRNVVCHPSAWDLYNNDFRIQMCTSVTMENFLIIHHEMGHIQYFLQYKDQPVVFRDGANAAFHEAVGEVIYLSAATPKHLYELGLLEDNEEDEESDINFLLKTALDTVGTLPFSLALEQWRWDVFAGKVPQNQWMQRWWELKEKLVGVRPPVERTEEDFEPGAMLHIVADVPFLRYYIRTIIQFQFHKAMCDAAGHTGPLHRCDIYRSTDACDKLANMLKLGSSEPWTDAMEAITGQREMSAEAIKEYFAPLMEWLQKTNEENGEDIGWDNPPDNPTDNPDDNDSGCFNSASVILIGITYLLCFYNSI